MKNKIYDLISYSFSAGEQIFLDTNIWIYLYPFTGNPSKTKTYRVKKIAEYFKSYSLAFKKLIEAKAQPVLDPMVLSEYLNGFCRHEWNGRYKSEFPIYKDFRNSTAFKNVASSAQKFAKKIIDDSEVLSFSTDKNMLMKILTEFGSGDLDFNDACFIELCAQKNIKLMTNDGDFRTERIEILTFNKKLLS